MKEIMPVQFSESNRYEIEGIGIVDANNVYLKAYANKRVPSYAFKWEQLEVGESTHYEFTLSEGRSVVKITRVS